MTVKAHLITGISYQKDGQEVFVPSGTNIQVDIDSLIAIVGQDHVDVFWEEFEIINPN